MKKLPMHGKDKQMVTDGKNGCSENDYVNKEFNTKKSNFKKIYEKISKKK